MAFRFDVSTGSGRRRGIDRAVTSVGLGELVVMPLESTYGLGCDAFVPEGAMALRSARGGAAWSLPPVMIGSARTLDGVATGLTHGARALVSAFWPGPLTLICRAQPTLAGDLAASGEIAVRMPLHPVALELLRRTGPMLVSAASMPGSEATVSGVQAREIFGDNVHVYLDAGHLAGEHEAGAGSSTIVDVTADVPQLVRAGGLSVTALRGVVPDLVVPDPEAAGLSTAEGSAG